MTNNQEFIKKIKRKMNKFLNKIARDNGYPRGYKQMIEENKDKLVGDSLK